jgi:hypothetical protein
VADPPEFFGVQPTGITLIDYIRQCESVAKNTLSAVQGGADNFGHQLSTGGHEQKSLGYGHQVQIRPVQ